MCFVFRHDLSDDVQLYCFRRWSKVKKEGSKEHSFAKDTPSEEASEGEEAGGLELPMLDLSLLEHLDDLHPEHDC
jgi:hypothetical protein